MHLLPPIFLPPKY